MQEMHTKIFEHLLVMCHIQDRDAVGAEDNKRKINSGKTNCEERLAP
jgi:hypothetical protein